MVMCVALSVLRNESLTHTHTKSDDASRRVCVRTTSCDRHRQTDDRVRVCVCRNRTRANRIASRALSSFILIHSTCGLMSAAHARFYSVPMRLPLVVVIGGSPRNGAIAQSRTHTSVAVCVCVIARMRVRTRKYNHINNNHAARDVATRAGDTR